MKSTNVQTKSMQKMSSTKIPVKVNSGHLTSNITYSIDGKVVRKEPGRSFLFYFIHTLHRMAARRSLLYRDERARVKVTNIVPEVVDGVNGVRVYLSGHIGGEFTSGVLIGGIENPKEVNGFWSRLETGYLESISGTDFFLPVPMEGDYQVIDERLNTVVRFDTNIIYSEALYSMSNLLNARLKLGYAEGEDHEFYAPKLFEEAWDLNEGTMNVSSLITTQEESRFIISRNFVNDTGDPRTFFELGLYTMTRWGGEGSAEPGEGGSDSSLFLLGRDKIGGGGVSLPHGSSLSVDVEIKSEVQNFNQDTETDGTNSALLEAFIYSLAGCLDDDTGAEIRLFRQCVLPSGEAINGSSADLRTFDSSLYGIVVGDDSHYASMTDRWLFGHMPHGEQGLYHHGNSVNKLEINEAEKWAEMTICRVFENRSGDPITIKEVGLSSSVHSSFGPYNNSNGPTLIMRTALDAGDQVTISAGQAHRFDYGLRIEW